MISYQNSKYPHTHRHTLVNIVEELLHLKKQIPYIFYLYILCRWLLRIYNGVQSNLIFIFYTYLMEAE